MRSLERHSIQLVAPAVLAEASPTVTIVICTRNRPAALRKCLKGIARLERTPDEVIVVDNTLGDRETEAAARAFDAFYVVEPTPGLSRARNRGMAESSADIVAYLDDDATPDTHWLERIIEPFEDPHVSSVTGRIVTSRSVAGNGVNRAPRSLSNKDSDWFAIASFGGLGTGSNMAFRKKSCIGLRIFDERLGRGAPFEIAEENYAFALLLSRGYTAIHLPGAIVFHPSPKAADIKRETRNSIAFSMLLFAEFPGQRLGLLRFLYRRLRRKPLTWPRETPDPGQIITSGWPVLLGATISAVFLFFFHPRKRGDQ